MPKDNSHKAPLQYSNKLQKEDQKKHKNQKINNKHKIKEFKEILTDYNIITLNDIGYFDDIEEAKRYLEHNILGPRLRKISNELLKLNINDPIEIFGRLDSLKLKSSMTLFDYIENNEVFEKVLDKYYEGEKDDKTIQILERNYK